MTNGIEYLIFLSMDTIFSSIYFNESIFALVSFEYRYSIVESKTSSSSSNGDEITILPELIKSIVILYFNLNRLISSLIVIPGPFISI